MSSLISNTGKTNLGNVFQSIHDTFSRPIVIFKTPNRIIINSDVNHNFFYGNNQEGLDFAYEPVSGVFPARILWQHAQETNSIQTNELPIKSPDFYARIKLRPDALEFISGYQEVWIDGKKCTVEGTSRPHGLFNVDFYSVYLKETL